MHRILQVGLAPKDNLEQWLNQDEIHSIVVLEPHPQQVHHLQQQYSDQPKLQLIEASLSTQPGLQTLLDYTLPGFSSLSPVTGLKRLFPGLQKQGSFEVNTLTPSEFLKQYSPETEQTATLVIQAKGYELELVKELLVSPNLLRFTDVVLYTGQAPLYENSVETEALQQQLVAAGYELIHAESISPEWVESHLKRDPAQDKIRLLEQDLEQAAVKQAEQEKQLEVLQAELAAGQKEALTTTERLTKELAQAKQSTVIAQEKLQALQAELMAGQTEARETSERLAKEREQAKEAEQAAVTRQTQLQVEVQSLQQAAVVEKNAADKQAQTLQDELKKAQKSASATVESIKKELAEKDKALIQSQQELQQAKQTQKELSEQLADTQKKLQDYEQWLRNRKKQVEELEHALQQEQEKNTQLQTEKNALAQLESRMEQLFIQQATQLQESTNALGKHVTKSFVDQRQHHQALAGLQQYLENGEQPLNFDAWSMGVDTITHLIRQIEQNNYDVIIEFGSGTSTVVIAKAIAQRLTSQRYSQITKNDSNKHLPYQDIESHDLPSVSGSQAAALLGKAEYDLPRQVISFEQDRNYLNQTKQALASHGVSQIVELVLAPLIPTTHSALPAEQKSLFYDCEKQLERLARLFEQRNARILVVVDGPFSPKNNPLIREPALGVVLQDLSAQHLDILLDDSHRSGEQQVLEHWQELCEERGLAYTAQSLDVVKGATWVTVRPE